jgi:hypothetical protein
MTARGLLISAPRSGAGKLVKRHLRDRYWPKAAEA